MDIWNSKSAIVSPGLDDLLVWMTVCLPRVETHVPCMILATACSSVRGMLFAWYLVPAVMVSMMYLMCCGGVCNCCSSDITCWSVVSSDVATNSRIIV